MKDFDKLIEESLSEIRAVGIVPGEIKSWEINRRAQSRWGLCRRQNDGTFVIQI